MRLLANLLLACLLTSALIQISNAQGGISIYWGTYGSDYYDEKSLVETCETGLYSIVNVGSVSQFGNGLDIEIDLSITALQIHLIAPMLANTFNLFGDDTVFHDYLARYLKDYSEEGTKPVYLSVAPQCPYPDDYLEDVIDTGVFDYVWVQFYQTQQYRNATCEYTTEAGADNLLSAWNTWTSSLKESEKLFLGLPASTNASFTGYVPADVLINQILPEIKDTSRYGGVMLWNRYYDIKSNYSSSIVDHVNLELIRQKTD
ncbi:hevamine-A-like [Ziziphus jujuba]|uniref:Hevamine-A-like n=1 Tax=Ziziphus jujuba TaxID=326968 RepID=A0A6P3ZIH4_ZIZJJ|nr:hevamine-A-like [Ziziphus jujuba]XP_060675868.1 hevamine-A-like [Ziziphus jujuba]